MSKQYARLSQQERDLESTNYIVKPQDKKPKRSCCFSTFVVLAVLVMICGGIAVIVGIFYTPQVNTLIDSYWKHGGNGTLPTNITSQATNATSGTKPTVAPPILTAGHPALPSNDTKMDGQKPTTPRNGTSNTNSTQTEVKQSSVQAEDEEADEDWKEKHGEKSPKLHEKKLGAGNGTAAHEHDGEMLDEAEEKFASWMIRLERFLEKTTGIHRPELVVPLFMLLCFLTSLALASCCCCIMMKRREIRRRRILGKIITDLQTGDSKAVLLDQDGDD